MFLKLVRYFSLPGLASILVVAGLLLFFYEHIATQSLLEHEARSNKALTQSFANTIWPHYKSFTQEAQELPAEALKQRPELERLDQQVHRQMRGLEVAKVKLYALNGKTIYSSQPEQIGADKSDNPGFLSARAGTPVSQITFRNQMYGFEGEIADRNLVTSYVPIRNRETGEVQAVFEVYSDVSPLVANLRKTRWTVAITVLGSLLAMCALFVWRATVFTQVRDQEREAAAQELRHQAFHDPLTGLPNRLGFQTMLDEATARAEKTGKKVGVLFLDLDRFKLVNDSLGHLAGDTLLKEVASRIKVELREHDQLCRMGGDEFTIIIDRLNNEEEIGKVAERIVRLFAAPFRVHDTEFLLSTSVGIAIASRKEKSHEDLLKRADAAMYKAKTSGRNRFAFYTEDVEHVASERLETELALQRALKNREFYLTYQPRVDGTSGQMIACEALLRWLRPGVGIVSPDAFIPALEESGLILPVGRWVLQEACGQARAWQLSGAGTTRVSVNVSALQFNDEHFVADVRHALREADLDPAHLEIELTENVLLTNIEHVTKKMQELKDLGVVVSIDDFGTGYSSLSYLQTLPIDFIKVDQSFVRGIAWDPRNAAITRAIASLATSLELKYVAEGVETDVDLEFLRGLGCPEMQGFLFSKPTSPENVANILRNQHRYFDRHQPALSQQPDYHTQSRR